jgi:formylglycine-generating enzyme required for sulfatase activity
MSVSKETWRGRLKDSLREWYVNPMEKLDSLGVKSIYCGLAASVFASAALASNDPSQLLPLSTGIGTNLVANILQGWKDEKSAAIEIQAEAEQHPELLEELKLIFDQLGLLQQIQKEQSLSDREWFERTLQQELRNINSVSVTAGNYGVAVGRDIRGNVYINSSPTKENLKLREAYLGWLIQQTRAVSLAGVDPLSVTEDTRRDIELAAVYTALMTQQTKEGREAVPDREMQRLSALEVLNVERRLALLGDPGSGKSTFVNFVTLCMAGEILSRSEFNLKHLSSPLPDDNGNHSSQDKKQKKETQPWEHGALLPVRVILRDFAARGLGPAGQQASCDTLWRFIIGELPHETLSGFDAILREEWLSVGGLLMLDGLDEVPDAENKREKIRGAIQDFIAAFSKVRVLVTSRTYAYQKQSWKLDGFAETVLAPFEMLQIRSFVKSWYAYVGTLRRIDPDDAQGRAARLNSAIQSNARLIELASRPLLLTLMASLHAWRGGSLPEQRESLYAEAVELLLNQWENQKLRRRPDGTYEYLQPSLAEWFDVDRKKVRELLDRLAFEAHRDQISLQGTADIAEEKLVRELMNLKQNPDVRPNRLVEYISARAGLLEPRGVGVYSFPHRTFQEYLAACYLTGDSYPDEVADLARNNPERWREVALLAGAKAARGVISAAWDLAEALCYENAPSGIQEQNIWGALLASQVLIENNCLEKISLRNQSKVDRIRQWLVLILDRGLLPPVDRALAGDALARIGDPRNLEELVEIPAGPFKMGSDKNLDKRAFEFEHPLHEVFVDSFSIGKYPVTAGQWKRFIQNASYKADPEAIEGLDNHPVVNVSWNDAAAYCSWLTKEWRQTGKISDREIVRLPTDAEWEKSARGTDGRIWPWGNAFESGMSNTFETRLLKVCAVGSFPQDISPYGVMDLAGNVLEWCRTKYQDYPYSAVDGRETLAGEESRVVRGGCFKSSQGFARCAYRFNFRPVNRYDLLGFRVVVSPASGF